MKYDYVQSNHYKVENDDESNVVKDENKIYTLFASEKSTSEKSTRSRKSKSNYKINKPENRYRLNGPLLLIRLKFLAIKQKFCFKLGDYAGS
ncbi:hypothetical protein BpHYR1_052553 [Brachionus plicatilis]|uniref:Uncharacterized protein n=1 Tax=Brachionus plicatilis TaxID=10195 RepID=A0A3M7QYZ6_BRAPC|nr:hypothetical protein BpHYR1_052553 [Brachionus plicatilis]